MDAIDGKKYVKFVAMQQNSATLIYDLNTMKGKVVRWLSLKNSTAIQNTSVPSLKNIAPTIMDKSVDTSEQNKRFLSASFRNSKKHLFCR